MARAKAAVRKRKALLLKLASMLEVDAKNNEGMRFDISSVGHTSSYDQIFSKENPPSLSCGTTACAMGLASISGKFKKQGLGYKVTDSNHKIWNTFNSRVVDFDQAAVKVFGVTQEEAQYMFAPYSYPYNKRIGAEGEREAIRRIKRVAADKPIIKNGSYF